MLIILCVSQCWLYYVSHNVGYTMCFTMLIILCVSQCWLYYAVSQCWLYYVSHNVDYTMCLTMLITLCVSQCWLYYASRNVDYALCLTMLIILCSIILTYELCWEWRKKYKYDEYFWHFLHTAQRQDWESRSDWICMLFLEIAVYLDPDHNRGSGSGSRLHPSFCSDLKETLLSVITKILAQTNENGKVQT